MNYFYIITLLFGLWISSIYTIPIDIKLNQENSGAAHFTIHLPNNDIVKVGLKVRLLKHVISPETSFNKTSTTTTTTTATKWSTPNFETEHPILADKAESIPQLVTVEQAIEALRQEIIEKEYDIGGIIEAENIFYRNFLLEGENNREIYVRCSYDVISSKTTLNIKCFEFKEILKERILSNGEVEQILEVDDRYKSDYTLLDLRKIKKSKKYSMTIN